MRVDSEAKLGVRRVLLVTAIERSEPSWRAKVAALPGEVYFGFNSSRLSSQTVVTLAKAIRWLNANPDAQLTIEGHADPAGNPDANMVLSQKRAELVRDHLVSAGIDASRVEVVPLGDTRLQYGRTDGRNRRAALVQK